MYQQTQYIHLKGKAGGKEFLDIFGYIFAYYFILELKSRSDRYFLNDRKSASRESCAILKIIAKGFRA